MKIAVIGSGISGNLAARILHSRHDVDVYEAGSHIGGHAHTVEVDVYGERTAVDVAFMVLNERTYPNMCRMLHSLGVETQASDMSFSVRNSRTQLEYQGSSLSGLFAQRRNLVRPSFYQMLADILRFNSRAIQFCESSDDSTTLREFLDDIKVGFAFRENYLIPMSAAIWSADPGCIGEFPAKFILGFMRNHGLLQLRDRPQWLTIKDRSRSYVNELIRPLRENIRLDCRVEQVARSGGEVELRFVNRPAQRYDHVVMATHADQTLRMLVDADQNETDTLSGFVYQTNEAVLHTDSCVLPQRRAAWASWNYHVPRLASQRASVTYDLNRLQNLRLPGPLCLTLNPSLRIQKPKVLSHFEFQHPVYSTASSRSQRRFDEINGRRSVSFCGAYWGYGFHEDGVNSALAVTRQFGLGLEALSDRRSSAVLDRSQAECEIAGGSR